MDLGTVVGFMAGGLVGFFAACLCRAAADNEPHEFPPYDAPNWRHTATMPPRSRTASMMFNPMEPSTWDSD